jgi:hypothetical protein
MSGEQLHISSVMYPIVFIWVSDYFLTLPLININYKINI